MLSTPAGVAIKMLRDLADRLEAGEVDVNAMAYGPVFLDPKDPYTHFSAMTQLSVTTYKTPVKSAMQKG